MNLPRTNRWGWMFLAALALPVFAFSQTPVPSSTSLTVNQTDKPIRVDGHLVDWPSTRMVLLDQKSQVTYGLLNWRSKDDFSARVFLTYDSQYLYLSAIVRKTSGVVNSNKGLSLWDGDCLELFLSSHSTESTTHISKGDYHIGFSPGTGCRDPQMFCFNKESGIGGGRISARPSLNGYILEACVPLSFFSGLEIGPGKTNRFDLALDEGGTASGSRILQLELNGNPDSWKNPSFWGQLEWNGQTTVSVPEEDEENLYANLVMDGTKNATFWGRKNVTGWVTNAQGKPLSGAWVATWPKTSLVQTAQDGSFKLDGAKVYDGTVIYARVDGYATSLVPIERGAAPVSVRLNELPSFLTGDDGARPGFYGQSFEVPADGNLIALMDQSKDRVQGLSLNFLKLVGTERLNAGEAEAALDHFVGFARAMGAEPMIELPIHRADLGSVAEWVRHCNVEKGEKVLYWTIGDEPDLYTERSKDPDLADYNVYDYINDFRVIYNAAKTVDPSVLILGPELAWRYSSGEDDWFTPFIQFNGDIVNLASIHHYPAIKAAKCNPAGVMDDVRHLQTLAHGLKDRLAINSDVYVPLVLTGGNICLESTDNTLTAQISATPAATSVKSSTTPVPKEDSGPKSFWAALWEAEQTGVLLNEHLPMAFSSYLSGNGALDFFDAKDARPDYWALKILSSTLRGKSLWAQVEDKNVSVYATQDPKTKDVALLLINRGNNYYHPKILLNAQEANVSIDAGLGMTFDRELPFYSMTLLQIKANGSPGKAYLYTKKMFQDGKPPEQSEIKPW